MHEFQVRFKHISAEYQERQASEFKRKQKVEKKK